MYQRIARALCAMMVFAASPSAWAVTSFTEDFDSYGDGSFAFVDGVSDDAFFDHNWNIMGDVLWSYTLEGDGSVSFQAGNPIDDSMQTAVTFEPGDYEIEVTLKNNTSARRSMFISLGGLYTLAELGGDGIIEQTFIFNATVNGTVNNRLRIGSAFPFSFTPDLTSINANMIPSPGVGAALCLAGAVGVRRRR